MAAVTLLSVALMTGLGMTAANANPQLVEPFASNSPFRTTIPSSAAVDRNSSAMVAQLARNGAAYANLVEFGIPIYHATSSTPRHSVRCTMNWGRCPFDGQRVPIPADAQPSSGSDGALVVIDSSTRQVFEFWQARRSGGGWTTSWGGISDLDGDGWTMQGNSTGSGASRLGGVVQVAEIQQGRIRHALALQTNNVCANTFRPPAIKTDGRSTRSDCIPEGARVRLDPALNLDSLGLTPGERTVAQALQTYGGYIVDVGGAPLSISFERDNSAGNGSIGSTYQNAGFKWDYDGLTGVPWDRLQVLAQSSGSGSSRPPADTQTPDQPDEDRDDTGTSEPPASDREQDRDQDAGDESNQDRDRGRDRYRDRDQDRSWDRRDDSRRGQWGRGWR